MDNPLADPVIARFRAALTDTYGARLERVVLFGSRARGDAAEDSDYDLAVFLHGSGTRADDIGRIADIETDILLDTNAVINALPLPAGSYKERTIFMSELRRDGIDL
jgi:predicted nucleotidyltransferase